MEVASTEQAPSSDRRWRRQFAMPLALVISVWLHLLIAAFSILLSLFGAAEVEARDEPTIEFSFADSPDPVDPADPAEAAPTPAMAPQARPNMLPDRIDAPQGAVVLPDSGQSEDPAESSPEPLDEAPQEESVEPPVEDPDPLREPEPFRDDADEVPPESVDGRVPLPQPRTAPPPPASPRLDLDQALQDFGQRLDRAHRANRPAAGTNQTGNNVFVPDTTLVPVESGYGVGNMVFESSDYVWDDYYRQIYVAIWQAWHNRLLAASDDFEKWAIRNSTWLLNNQNQIRFTIQRQGDVSTIVVEAPSGCSPLDASATDALAEVILPPLPSDFPRDSEVVHVRFVAVGQIRGMRQHLLQLKRAGLF